MSLLDLSQKYGRTKSRQSVNAAIRAEIAGGNEVVDLTAKYGAMYSAVQNGKVVPESERILLEQVFSDLQRVRDVMGDEIARRYGLKTKLAEEETANV